MSCRQPRQGMTFVELLVAMMVVSIVLTTLAQWLVSANRGVARQSHQLARLALATNLLEQLDALPYDRLRQDVLQSAEFTDLMPSSSAPLQASLEIVEMPLPERGKRLKLSVADHRRPPNEPPLVLVAWRFSNELPEQEGRRDP